MPYLVVKGAADAIAFYQRVFGAETLFRLNEPKGSVMHAELRVGPAHFMLTEESPAHGALGPLSIGGSASSATLYVPDADAVFERAVNAGSTVLMPMQNQFWGDRAGAVTDPFGHKWFIATRLEEPSPQEIEQRVAKLFASGGPC
ncbi:MAG TPA: VOC family protein [Albitalea sp.]|nr:VOC family protein [Albitalea sp.]